ncbi:MAG: hypothetical protein DHS20C21_03140 [Gemmatimonadota bacterium]|nr:MAG: hypothetical protein DHS20C21_03140 [Gemmatimonadota bacterium]
MTDQEKFLDELAALTIKYGIEIDGCGCCGSPFLYEVDAEKGRYEVDSEGNNLSFKEVE